MRQKNNGQSLLPLGLRLFRGRIFLFFFKLVFPQHQVVHALLLRSPGEGAMQDQTDLPSTGNRGFTLIELLTVVAIIGVLAAIAIPQFVTYRQRSFDATAETDLRNAATAEEAYYINNYIYITCSNLADCKSKLPGYDGSNGVAIALTAGADSFTGTSSHSRGSGRIWTFDSTKGRIPQ
jgi:type IV pilus assembly protein PilA